MTNTGPALPVQAEVKSALLAYFEALALAEPIQERLWQIAAVTLTQAQVLRALRDGPQTLGKLGQANGLSPTSVTRIVDRLERRGLVSRRRESEDRRLVQVHLETAGERLLGEVRLVNGSDLHLAVEAMTDDERHRLTSSLRRLVELARAARPMELVRE